MSGLQGRFSCIAAVSFCAFALGWLMLHTFEAQIHYDAAYNFLAYKNLVDIGQFIHTYGSADTVFFNPVISTGPAVNFPIALFYRFFQEVDGIFWGTTLTNGLYWLFFCVVGFRLTPFPVMKYFFPLLGLGFYLHHINFTEGTLLTGLGEHYAVLFILFGCYLLSRPQAWLKLCGYLCFGLSLLTKVNMVVGFSIPLVVWLGFLIMQIFQRRLRFKPRLIFLHLFGLVLVGMPIHCFKNVLPRTVLPHDDYVTYKQVSLAWHEEVGGFAFWDVTEMLAYWKTGDKLHLTNVQENLQGKVSELKRFYGGSAEAAITLLASIPMLLVFYRFRQLPDAQVMGYFLLFGISIGLWWFFCNKSLWYRYYFPCDLIFQISMAYAAVMLLAKGWGILETRSADWSSWLSLVYLLLAFIAIPAILPRFDYSRFFATSRDAKAVDQRVAEFASREGEHSIFFGYGWIQSPNIRALAHLNFFNMLRPADVNNAVDSGLPLYIIYDPIYKSVGLDDQAIMQKAEKLIYRDGPYSLYKLSSSQLHSKGKL